MERAGSLEGSEQAVVIDGEAPGGYTAQVAREPLQLEIVRQAADRSRLDGVEEDVPHLPAGQDDRPRAVGDATDQAQARTSREVDLSGHDIGGALRREPIRFQLVGGPSHRLDLWILQERGDQRLAEERLRVDDEDSDGHAGIVVVSLARSK